MEPAGSGLKVIKAEFRAATDQEKQEMRGGICYRISNTVWNIFAKGFGTIDFLRKGPNIFAWSQSYLQQLSDYVSLSMDYKDRNFLSTFPNFFSTYHFIEDQSKVGIALIKHHRNDNLFQTSMGMQQIFKLIDEDVFPKDIFTENDSILNCDLEHSEMYHTLLRTMLSEKVIEDYVPTIEKLATKSLEEMAKMNRPIDIVMESRKYASNIFTTLLFGRKYYSEPLAKAVDFINTYVLKKALGSILLSEEDKAEAKKSFALLAKTIEELLSQKELPLFGKDSSLTISQKKAMLFIMLFAGQETTAALLSYITWQLALHPNMFELLRLAVEKSNEEEASKIIENFFTESMRQFQPAHAFSRVLQKDACLEYQLEGEDFMRKRYFFEKETISLNVKQMANHFSESPGNKVNDWFGFGGGKHLCPGMKLAKREICEFIKLLVTTCTLSSTQKEAKIVAQVTLRFDAPVYVTIRKNDPKSKQPLEIKV